MTNIRSVLSMRLGIRDYKDNVTIEDIPVFNAGRELRYYESLRDCCWSIALIVCLLDGSKRRQQSEYPAFVFGQSLRIHNDAGHVIPRRTGSAPVSFANPRRLRGFLLLTRSWKSPRLMPILIDATSRN